MIVSLTIIRYPKRTIPFALLAMALHRLPLVLNKGCTFYKLMGSGHNGAFDLRPDWQQWGLLAVWRSPEDFERFYQRSLISRWWQILATEKWTTVLRPLASHGTWDGKAPFDTPAASNFAGPIAVLTRATIRFSRIRNFWKAVDSVANMMSKAPGFVTSVGIGEAPVYRQATFSVWENVEAMKAFAYGSAEHATVIKKTRAENWYSEELFARFEILESRGTLHGVNPLKQILTSEQSS